MKSEIKTSNNIEIAGVVSCLPKRKIENSDIDVLSYNNSENLSNLDINSNEIIDNLYSALEKAINDEEYEVAAKIRDRIKQIDK